MEKQQKVVGVYHKNCTDGTTAAAVLLKRFPNAQLFPFEYGFEHGDDPECFTALLDSISPETTVYIIDFSFKENLVDLLSRAKRVINIDHHVSAREFLEKQAAQHRNYEYIFDNNRSGASLAWSYFFPNEKEPEIVALAEDLDLWRWRFGEKTKALSKYSVFLLNKPEQVLTYFSKSIDPILSEGGTIARFSDVLLKNFIENTPATLLAVGKYRVHSFNAPRLFASELGNLFSKQHNEALAIFKFKGDGVTFSFRSTDTCSPSALDLAQILGGGGHRNAAGAAVPLKEFCKMLI